MKWLVATKRKTGGLNYSKAITFGMPAGRGRKGERQPRSRRGKQTTSMVVPRNPLPSAPSVRENECENRPDGAQLHELFPASCQPSVATHQAQPSPLYPAVYNPPGVPFHGGRFHHPYASTFQAHTPQACFQAAPPHRSLSIPPGRSASARAWHPGLSPHSYYLVALPKNVKKNAMVAVTFFLKNFVSHHTTSWLSTSTVGWYAGTRAQERWCTAQTLPTLITIPVLYIS